MRNLKGNWRSVRSPPMVLKKKMEATTREGKTVIVIVIVVQDTSPNDAVCE